MAIEIEHKYLVNGESYKDMAEECHHIMQGYLSTQKQRTVRVRVIDNRAFITVKGENSGATRCEYEYEIPCDDARAMLSNLCLKPIIEKYRYIVRYEQNRWEVDEFKGNLNGLVMAEIELPCEQYAYAKPPFVGENVTGDPRYYNSSLACAQTVPQRAEE
ncbi:MAG: CYTH domain-containing protein [Muribaculaceae bacterium]